MCCFHRRSHVLYHPLFCHSPTADRGVLSLPIRWGRVFGVRDVTARQASETKR